MPADQRCSSPSTARTEARWREDEEGVDAGLALDLGRGAAAPRHERQAAAPRSGTGVRLVGGRRAEGGGDRKAHEKTRCPGIA